MNLNSGYLKQLQKKKKTYEDLKVLIQSIIMIMIVVVNLLSIVVFLIADYIS